MTGGLEDRIKATRIAGDASKTRAVDPADGYDLLARHVFEVDLPIDAASR